MATPEEIINDAVERSIELAEEFTAQADTAADRALALSQGRSNHFGYWDSPPIVSAVEPVVPDSDSYIALYESQYQSLVAFLSAKFTDFMNLYFPITTDAYDEAMAWTVNTIQNGGTGIPVAVEEQIWNRARSKIIREGQRLEDTIISGDAARGLSKPSGQMFFDLTYSRNEQAGRVGENATNIALKQAEIQIDTIKFAIGTAIDARFKAVRAAADYITAMVAGPDISSRLAIHEADAKARMMAATSDLYRARLQRDQLIIGSNDNHTNASVHHEQNRLSAVQAQINGEVQAAHVAAQTYSEVAKAAIAQFNGIMSSTVSAFA